MYTIVILTRKRLGQLQLTAWPQAATINAHVRSPEGPGVLFQTQFG